MIASVGDKLAYFADSLCLAAECSCVEPSGSGIAIDTVGQQRLEVPNWKSHTLC